MRKDTNDRVLDQLSNDERKAFRRRGRQARGDGLHQRHLARGVHNLEKSVVGGLPRDVVVEQRFVLELRGLTGKAQFPPGENVDVVG